MRRVLTVAIAVGMFLPLAALGEEKNVKSRITSVGLFKNGLAVVKRELTLPAPGTYRVDDVPQPVHGTFWIESNVKITTRLSTRIVETTPKRSATVDFQEALVGKEVTIHFTDGRIPPATGRVVAVEPQRGTGAWSRNYQRSHYYGSWNQQQPTGRTQFLTLATQTGRCYVTTSQIAYLQTKGDKGTIRVRRPVLLFTAEAMKEKPATVTISYLSKGLSWAPSYRVDISDPKTLQVRQKAVIKNELADLTGAEVRLISGFPSVRFAHVVSPLSLATTWTSFFTQLNQRPRSGHASTSNAIYQQVASNVSAPSGGMDLSAVPTGEGVDLHYQDIGKQTLAEGDSLAISVASAQAKYDRIVEWIVPDTREANGRHISDYQRRQDPEKHQDAAWDAVRFKNPLTFPMTTAPAMVVSNGQFNGQQMSYWVNVGERTTLHVTKALSIRTRNTEQEEAGKREIVYVGGKTFRKTKVTGELRANNHRKETITLVIRRRFSGDLLKADGSPKSVLMEEGAYSVNKRNELIWSLQLKPGGEIKLKYSYSVLVYH